MSLERTADVPDWQLLKQANHLLSDFLPLLNQASIIMAKAITTIQMVKPFSALLITPSRKCLTFQCTLDCFQANAHHYTLALFVQ